MATGYFTDRERGLTPRVNTDISGAVWGGIVVLIEKYISNGGFGIDYPADCPDGSGVFGTDINNFSLALQAEFSGVAFPLNRTEVPETFAVLDLLEFCYSHVAAPIAGSFHEYFRHEHLGFDREQGRREFQQSVERIFARNQLVYEMREDGTIARLAPPILRETLMESVFATGEAKLDELLETARMKFLSSDATVRREALEKLWDAWERLKTVEDGNKKVSTQVLLDKAAQEPTFRNVLEKEALRLTKFGNKFHIRHSETNQIELQSDTHVDYLFHRLFALIWLLLRAGK